MIVGNSYNASCDEKTVPTVAYVTFAAELHIFRISVSTPAYTSLTNCVWEGARSQAEAAWALSTIRGCHVYSHKSNSECSTILDWIQRAVVLQDFLLLARISRAALGTGLRGIPSCPQVDSLPTDQL